LERVQAGGGGEDPVQDSDRFRGQVGAQDQPKEPAEVQPSTLSLEGPAQAQISGAPPSSAGNPEREPDDDCLPDERADEAQGEEGGVVLPFIDSGEDYDLREYKGEKGKEGGDAGIP